MSTPTYWQTQFQNASEFASDTEKRAKTNGNQSAAEIARIAAVEKKYTSMQFRSRPSLMQEQQNPPK